MISLHIQYFVALTGGEEPVDDIAQDAALDIFPKSKSSSAEKTTSKK